MGKIHDRLQPGVRSILINTFFLSGARITVTSARFIYAIVIAKLLGPELYGLFNYGLSWYLLFIPLSIFGIDLILLRELARHENNEVLLNNSLTLRGICCIVVACLCIGIALKVENVGQMKSILIIFSLALAGRGISSWSNTVFKGYEASYFVLRQEIFFRLLEVISGTVLLVNGYSLLSLAVVHAVSWLLQGIIGVLIVRRYLHPTLYPRWDLKIVLDLIKKGLPFLCSAFLLGWLIQGPLVLFRHFFKSGSILGQIALALQIFVLIGSIVAEFSSAALPVLSRSVQRKDGKARQFVVVIFRGGWLLSGILIIVTLTFGKWAVVSFFGNEFVQAGDLLPWATALVGPFFWCSNLRSVLVSQGHYNFVLVANLASSAAFIVAFFPFVSVWGSKGVFIALGIGLLILVSVQSWGISQTDSIDWINSIFNPFLAILISVVICLLLMPDHSWFGLLSGLVSLFCTFLLFGLMSLEDLRNVLR